MPTDLNLIQNMWLDSRSTIYACWLYNLTEEEEFTKKNEVKLKLFYIIYSIYINLHDCE